LKNRPGKARFFCLNGALLNEIYYLVQPQRPTDRVQMKNVLLIDDDSTFQFIGKALLKYVGVPPENIQSALSGKHAIDLLTSFHSAGKMLPDLILLDLNMPIMDGFGFLDAFNKLDYPNKDKAKIIVLTSSQNSSDMERAKQFGVTRYMTKPLQEEALRAELA
jgi:CheY-like chemotaxis protein